VWQPRALKEKHNPRAENKGTPLLFLRRGCHKNSGEASFCGWGGKGCDHPLQQIPPHTISTKTICLLSYIPIIKMSSFMSEAKQ